MKQFDGTTILCVRRGNEVAVGGDGQVSMGNTCVKSNARKVRWLYQERVIAGFAGGTADAFTLFERFEGKLEKHGGQLVRAAVEMAKDWRTDRYLRRLEALLIVADRESGVLAIGSGGSFAQAAALALVGNTQLGAREIVERSLHIAADICIYTNHHLTIETFDEAR